MPSCSFCWRFVTLQESMIAGTSSTLCLHRCDSIELVASELLLVLGSLPYISSVSPSSSWRTLGKIITAWTGKAAGPPIYPAPHRRKMNFELRFAIIDFLHIVGGEPCIYMIGEDGFEGVVTQCTTARNFSQALLKMKTTTFQTQQRLVFDFFMVQLTSSFFCQQSQCGD